MHRTHSMTMGNKAVPQIFFVLALALLAALTLAPVALQDGWPMNHEFNLPWSFNSFYLRTEVYAEHMRQGDFLPIWSSADNEGFGSPQPLMYHKLFYLVSGAFYVLSWHMKASIMLSLWVFLLVGALGTHRLCRALGCDRYLANCGAALLLLANYTVTNWLVRGAMAEFSAAMLAPWVLALFIDWLQHPERHPTRQITLLGLSLALLFLAHSVLAFYLTLLMATAFLILLLFREASIRTLSIASIAWGVLLFVLVAGPYIFAMRVIGAAYDMRRIIPAPFLPENQIKPLQNYFWDDQWLWGKVWDSYTVQLDLPVFLLLATGLLLLAYQMLHRKFTQHAAAASANPLNSVSPGIWGLSILLLLCIALQTRWAIPFYQRVPGAAFIQFPWRLLAVLTPGLIALSLCLWQRLNITLSAIAPGLCVVASLGLCGAWAPLMYGNTPHDQASVSNFKFGAFGEYTPAVAGTEPSYTVTLIRQQLSEKGCVLSVSNATPHESLRINYELSCSQPGTYSLPLFGSPLHRIWLASKENGTTHEGCAVSSETPGLCAVTLTVPGTYQIQVEMPTLMSWLPQLR